MAISLNFAGFASLIPTGTSVSVLTNSGSNIAMLVVLVQCNSTFNTPVSCTYNGVSLTDVSSGAQLIFGLINPSVGTFNFIPTFAGGGKVSCYFLTMNGVDQTGGSTTFPNYSGTNSGSGTVASVSVTSSLGQWVCAGYIDGPPNITAFTTAGNGTSIGNNASDGSAANNATASNYDVNVGGSSVSMSYNLAGSASWTGYGIAVKPFTAAAASPVLGRVGV